MAPAKESPPWATLLAVENPAHAWCRAVGPDVGVRVLSHFPSGPGRAIEDVELVGAMWKERVAAIRRLPSVRSVATLESASHGARLRMEVGDSRLQHAVAQSGALPRFPFEVRDGLDQWLLVSGRREAERFVNDLRAQGVRATILSSREYHPHEALTERQREFMRAAIEQGYYDVPRRVTLTQLAEELQVSKSSLSETLARGERRVVADTGLFAPLRRTRPESAASSLP